MKIQVERNNGKIEIIEVDHFDADNIAEKVNNGQNIVVAIGDQLFSRIEIAHAKILSDESV